MDKKSHILNEYKKLEYEDASLLFLSRDIIEKYIFYPDFELITKGIILLNRFLCEN